MLSLQDDILSSLNDLAGSRAAEPAGPEAQPSHVGSSSPTCTGSGGSTVSGGGVGGGSLAGYPAPWLLLDLQEMLPGGSSLSKKLQQNEEQLWKELEAAQGNWQVACRMAASLLEGIGADTYSAGQLAAQLCQNGDMLALCMGGLKAGEPRNLQQAAGALCTAVWQEFSGRAGRVQTLTGALSRGSGSLPTSVSPLQLRQEQAAAVDEAALALEIATQLTQSHPQMEQALLQHGDSLAAFFGTSTELAAGADRSRLPEGLDSKLSEVLAWWAENAPRAASQAQQHRSYIQAGPCFAITDLFLRVTIPRLAERPPSYKGLRPGRSPAASLTRVLDVLLACSPARRVQSTPAGNAAKRLLGRHTGQLMYLLTSLLLQTPNDGVLVSAGSGLGAGPPTDRGADRAQAAAAGLMQLTDAAVACVVAVAADRGARHGVDRRDVRALMGALEEVLTGTAGCLSWVPWADQHTLRALCSEVLRQLAPLLAPLPSLPPARDVPSSQREPASQRSGPRAAAQADAAAGQPGEERGDMQSGQLSGVMAGQERPRSYAEAAARGQQPGGSWEVEGSAAAQHGRGVLGKTKDAIKKWLLG